MHGWAKGLSQQTIAQPNAQQKQGANASSLGNANASKNCRSLLIAQRVFLKSRWFNFYKMSIPGGPSPTPSPSSPPTSSPTPSPTAGSIEPIPDEPIIVPTSAPTESSLPTEPSEDTSLTCYWGDETIHATSTGCVPEDNCKNYADKSEAMKACREAGGACGGIELDKDGVWQIKANKRSQPGNNSIIQRLACGTWGEFLDETGKNGKGCALSGYQVEGGWGKSLAECKKFCIKASPRRANNLLSTKFIEYHENSYCGCFSTCNLTRPADYFASKPSVYEFDSLDIDNQHGLHKKEYKARYENNPCLDKVCAYSSDATWGNDGIPTKFDTDMIYIQERVTLLLDQDVDIRFWVIEGTMVADTAKSLTMAAEGIFVNGGTLRVGEPGTPFPFDFTFKLKGHWHSPKIPVFGIKCIGVTTGNLELYGKPVETTWVELAETAQKGSSELKVLGTSAANWPAGSKLVLAGTDRPELDCDVDRKDECHTEEVELVSAAVAGSGVLLTLKEPLKYRHLAEDDKDPLAGSKDTSIRAEVGILSRSIRVIGSQDLDGTEHFGAHVMMLKIDKVALEYVEFFHVGQAHQLGRYPVHFHHSGVVYGRAHVRGCAIHRTFNRAITNHATHGLTVENNVAYNVQGMAYFFEDAVETGAFYRGNLGVLVRRSFSLLQKDLTPAVFWVTHPNNTLIDNHAAGSHSFGFWFDIQGAPQGLSSGMKGVFPKKTSLGLVRNNTAHSNGERGLWITNYDPVDTNDKRVTAVFESFKTWGNTNGFEALEVGHIWVKDHISISDGEEAMTIAVAFADQWGVESNNFNSPAMVGAYIKASSSLPTSLWTLCGIHGPTNDYVNVINVSAPDKFRKGIYCGCKWCPTPFTGGLETRFYGMQLTSQSRFIGKGWRSNYDSILGDMDGSLSGLPTCHLHGCWVHSKIDKGFGYFPKDKCQKTPLGLVCSKDIGLRTLRMRAIRPTDLQFKQIIVTTKHGSATSGFYFYDFTRNRQAFGVRHFTMVTDLNHKVAVDLHDRVQDIESFGGELCDLRQNEKVYLSLETIANPVSFKFNGHSKSLETMSEMGCPKVCLSRGRGDCMFSYKLPQGRKAGYCSKNGGEVNCEGCRLKALSDSSARYTDDVYDTSKPYRLVKVGAECKSPEILLGKDFPTVASCAQACAKKEDCEYFIYGHGMKRRRCYQEKTKSVDCPEGWDPDMYNFYAVRRNVDPNTKIAIGLEDLLGTPDNNGLWNYSNAAEVWDVNDWHPGMFMGMINGQTTGYFKNKSGTFDGSSDEYPVSTWGKTSVQPCVPVSFQRIEATASACADKKDDVMAGANATPKVLDWCSPEFEGAIAPFRRTIWGTEIATYDTIVIPQTWTVNFNCDKLIRIKALELHGELIFTPGGDRTLQATHIFVSHVGKIRAGSKESPFPNTLKILLEGHRRTPHWPAGDLGNKFLVSTGVVELYGAAQPTWSKLATTAPAGSKNLNLEQDLNLKPGDTIIVTTSSQSKDDTEKLQVQSASGTSVTVKSRLANEHFGLEVMNDGRPETQGMMAAEVAVLRGNIIIEGLDTPGMGGISSIKEEKWGAVVKIFSLKEQCLVSEGVIHMQGVEMVHCGRDIVSCIEIDSAGESVVKDTVVRHGLGDGFTGGFSGIKASETTQLLGNFIYNFPKGHGIEMKNAGVTIGNLVAYTGYGYKYSVAGTFKDNIAAGCAGYAEFKQPKGVCAFASMTAPGSMKSTGNVFRSCGNGVLVVGGSSGRCVRDVPSKLAYRKTTKCGTAGGMSIIHVSQLGIRVDRIGASVVISGVKFINAGKGVSMSGTGASSEDHSTATPDIRLEVRNCEFFTNNCKSVGVNAATFYNAWLRIHRPLQPPSLYGGTVVENTKFYGFGKCSPALTNDVEGGWPVSLVDGAHYAMYTKGLEFIGGDEKNRVKFHASSGACVQMECDGRRSSVIVDTDGTLLGSPGTIVARSESGFKYKLLPHTFRFDADGKTIPKNDLYTDPGIYRKGCTLESGWNAWRCPGGKHRHLIIESMDPDWLSRRYAPVSVEVNADFRSYGGNVALYTGPGTENTGMVQAFWTVAHVGMQHNVYFSSTNPGRTRLHLRDVTPSEGIILSVYYGQPNRVEVYKGGKRVQMLAEPTWDDRSFPKLDLSMPSGTHIYDRIGVNFKDRRPGYLHLVMKGPEPLELIVRKKIKLTKKLEVGEQEFVFQKGSQGLTRNIALLMNIPESRIKVVGLGSMKKGEIWGEHNGVANGYSPTSLLENLAEGPNNTMEVMIDGPEGENEDECEWLDQSLVKVLTRAVDVCNEGTLKCAEKPTYDGSPVPGWTCEASMYGSGNGCDCDCGIWDPDCDSNVKFSYGIVQDETTEDMKLLDTTRMELLLKRFDVKVRDHKFDIEEMKDIRAIFDPNDPLRELAEEVFAADGKFHTLLKMAPAEKCLNGKVCLQHPMRSTSIGNNETAPMGVCTSMDAKEKGAGCDEMPCGTCETSKCVPDPTNNYGYTCVPVFNGSSLTVHAGVTDGYLGKWNIRRRRHDSYMFTTQTSVIGNDKFEWVGKGKCLDEKIITIGLRDSEGGKKCVPQKECEALALSKGANSYTWKRRCHGRFGQECTVYKGYCTSSSGSRHWSAYGRQESKQMWTLNATEDPTKFTVMNFRGGCLVASSGSATSEFGHAGYVNCNHDAASGPEGKWDVFVDCESKAAIKSIYSGKCLSLAKGPYKGLPELRKCDPGDAAQKWEIAGSHP
jgi:hypothetical protein